MALVGIVLASVLGMSFYSTYANQKEIIESSLDWNLEGGLNNDLTIGHDPEDESDREHEGANMLALNVEISADGIVLETSDSPVNISEATLADVIDEVLSSDDYVGAIPKRHVSWKAAETTSGSIRIAIVDTSASDYTLKQIMIRDTEIIVIGLAAMFAISWFLSGWALKPVAKAWEDQKRFVADASHELKTPLAVILANTDILLKDKGVPDESRRWIESTSDEANHMKGLVNDLLQLARADESAAGMTDALHHEDVDFSEIVSSAALEFDAVAFEHGSLLDDDIEPEIHLVGDGEWLERLPKILLDNAVKYSEPNSTISVRLKRQGKGCRLTVNNRGVPIDPKDLEHIFDRFYRSDKARSRSDGAGGFGLGLAIAKGITEAHGGTIRCTSNEQDGTTFTVNFEHVAAQPAKGGPKGDAKDKGAKAPSHDK